MGALMNGMNLHGGIRSYGGTFLMFLDYMRPSVRLSAHMGQPNIYVFSKKVDLREMLPESEMNRLWNEIHEAARLEGRSVFEVSSALGMMVYNQLARVGHGAVGSVKVGFDLLNDNVLEYYASSLAEMHRKGYYQSILEASGPYLTGLALLFQPSRETYTEKVLKGKPFRALWGKIRGCCGGKKEAPPTPPASAPGEGG